MSKSTYPNKKISNIWMLPIILMIGFVPLIVHTYEYKCGLSQFDWFPNASESQVDVFFAWKMIAAIILGVVMLGLIIFRYTKKKERLPLDNAFYLLFFYALFVAMSALFSPYKYWVMRGTYELFESVWVTFAYIVLCFYTSQYVRDTTHVVSVLRWSGVGMLIVSFIGAFQYVGSDFFKTTVGKHLLSSPKYWNDLDQIGFVMGENTSYTTLYNPNYLSFYFGMLIPLAACLFLASKGFVHKFLMAMVFILSVMCMVGSHSDSGWLALAIAAGIVILVLTSRTKKTSIAAGGVVVLGLAVLIALCSLTPLGTRLKTTITGTYHMEDRFSLRSIEAGSDYVSLDIRGNKMLISYAINETDGSSTLSCTDPNGALLTRTLVDEANMIEQLDDPNYSGCMIQPILLDDKLGIRVMLEGATWDFVYVQNDGYYYANSAGKLTRPSPIKSVNWFREDTMSGRGHIWNCTVPLLGKHIFVGVGANAYMLAYPQDDYIYHAYVSGPNNYDVKAHCWYLQQWVENGLFGLLLLLGFMGWYILRSARIYRKASLTESLTWVGIGLFTAVLVYLVAAVANDSNVCTAPVFWGCLGLGMAVNRMVETRIKYDTPAPAETVSDKETVSPSDTKSHASTVKPVEEHIPAIKPVEEHIPAIKPEGEHIPAIKQEGKVTSSTSKTSGKKKSGRKKVRGKH